MENVNYQRELKVAIESLKGIIADAQNRIGIIETFLYLIAKEHSVKPEEKVGA